METTLGNIMKRTLLFLLLVLLALPLSACGKKGPPIPQDAKNMFAWKAAKASRATVMKNGEPRNCLTVLADMTGATSNVEAFLLELEPQTGDICLECPFSPGETQVVNPISTQTYQDTVRYTFSYCPTKEAPAYRVRLVARNVFASFPYAMTKILNVN